jgi:O-antigen/teichoic acid export membrane protein
LSNTKKVLKNSGIYGIVSILQKAIGFFLLPLYTAYLSTTDYGIIGVVSSIVSFLSLFYMLSLNGAVTRFYYEYKSDEERVKELWGTIITFVLINSLLLSSILFTFHKYLLDPFAKGINFYPYIFLGLIAITLNPMYSIFQSTLQTRQIGRKYGLNNLIFFIINLVLTIILVVVFNLKAVGVLLAAAITNGIFFIYESPITG